MTCSRRIVMLSTYAAWVAAPLLADGPIIADGEVLPRYLTDAERAYLETHPLTGPSTRGTVSPSGPTRCVGEYEPMDGLCLSWEGGASLTSIVAQMAARITNEGNANVYVACDSASVRSTAQTSLTSAGANMSRVFFVVRTMDSIWIRDYGPRYVYEGGCRAIVDHVYNRPRPNDNTFPVAFAGFKHHERYDLPLVHGGGNYHLEGLGGSYCTRLVNNENNGGGDLYNYTEPQIHNLWQDFQNVDTTFLEPFPTTVDLTQHIDMWVQIHADRGVFVSDWPSNVGSIQDNICDSTATLLSGRGFTVTRLPARLVGGTHYTYTNMVICNDIVLLPSYTNSTVAPHNAPALAAVQAAMPEKQVFQINCQNIIGLAGAMHCIAMHVPLHSGGQHPTVFLRNPRGGEALQPDQSYAIEWISDDDESVSNVDLLLSTDGGATYPTTLASQIADSGSFTWTVPQLVASHARIKIVARDAGARTGEYESDSDFSIGFPACPGDIDGDRAIGLEDLAALLASFGQRRLDPGYLPAADLDGSNAIDLGDLAALLAAFGSACP